MARLTRLTLLGASILAASLGLSACGSGGAVAQARASCVDVKTALRLDQAAQAPGLSSEQSAALESKAMAALLRATPAAARATSIDGSWNPLMTTINEAERVPIANLRASLTRMCQIANSSTPYL